MKSFSKRSVWIVFGAVLTLLCASMSASAQIKLTLWHGITADDRQGIEDLVNRFNQEYAGQIQVEHTPILWDDYYAKTQVAVAAGTPPDIGIQHRDRLPERAQLGILRPIDDLWEKWGYRDDMFLPGVADETLWEGRRYAVPLDVHPLLLYYNRSQLLEAGLNGPPTTPEEFIDQARKLTRREGDRVTRWGTRFGMWGPQFYTLLRQRGGDYFGGDDYREVIVDNEAGIEAMQYIYDLMFTLQVAPPPEIWPDPYALEVSLFVDGIWWLSGIQANRDSADFHVAPADTIYGNVERAVWAGSHQFVVFKQPTEDPERINAVMTFIDWMSRHSATWASYGQLPVRIDAVESDEFRALEDHQKFMFQRFVFTPMVPWGTGMGRIEDFMWRAFDPRHPEFTDIRNALIYGKGQLQNLIEEMSRVGE